MRNAEISRKTAETEILLSLNLDGKGNSEINSGCGFLDHMLTLFSKHAKFDLNINCKGDTYVDYHHTTEDIAIVLGKAFKSALADKKGIERYADTCLPMDECLILSAADISGRGVLRYTVNIPAQKVGDFDTELCEEFWQGFVREAGIALHIRLLDGTNSHHIIEGIFKSVARTLRKAVSVDSKFSDEIPSTKGVL
ncbi:MAG: imidazoleglycerol-phosphate dehydratase HisB [Acutalibacteraceae bacterium]|jgi:imidazoleglycerol-phosphate dehydratase|nr:imidazoleglycerol-phosphate dehydratase HisB [Acutalibacteraceae bacterium]